MFAYNVYPYKHGLNYFDNKTLVDPSELKAYVREEIKKERNDFKVSFDEYQDISKYQNNLTDYYNSELRNWLGIPFKNYYDVKGIENFTSFPFIDYNDNFITAQLIKYGKDGKRIKTGYSTTWLHSHKKAKKELGLSADDKYNVKISCFFGEHYLKGSNKPVAIVEAPKTAMILKELYPGIDWIATAGEVALFSKDLSVLDGRKFILYPDAHTTQWKEFGESNGFTVSNVLECPECEKGSDIADFIFKSDHPAYTKIHAELYSIKKGEFDFTYNADLLELNFNNTNEKIEYFTAVPQFFNGVQVRLKQDSSFKFKKVFQRISSTGVSGSRPQALPSSVSMWTSSLKLGSTRASNRSNVIPRLPPMRSFIMSPVLTP